MMRRLRNIVVVLLIFGSGVVLGAVLAGTAAFTDVTDKIFRGGPKSVRKLIIERAKFSLQLDEDQQHEFWKILTETGVELRAASKPAEPGYHAAFEKCELRLRNVLRPEQREKFDPWVMRMRESWGGEPDGK